MKTRLYLVGGGGHCLSCIEAIESAGSHAIAGIVDLPERIGTEVAGYRVMASDADIPALAAQGDGPAFLVTLGQLNSCSARRGFFRLLDSLGADMPVMAASTARIARGAAVGKGTIVMQFAFVNAGASVGMNCIVNTRSLVEHDALIGDHCHLSTGAVVNGGARVGEGCLLGSGSILLQGVSIAPGTVVGAGSVVIRDIEEPGVYVGNPARRVSPGKGRI